MSGFVRRFTNFPPDDVITAIEGINIIDLPPPGSIAGINENVVALVGEFADMTFATGVDSSGVISTSIEPTEIVTGQDLVNKLGGFDFTLGQFGADCGNGMVELRNKSFGRLVVAPVNLASVSGVRLWRQLATNKSATDPTPIIPTAGATVPAPLTFVQTSTPIERLNIAGRVSFSGAEAYAVATDGSTTTASSAATQTLTSASGAFTTVARSDGKVGVEVGDIVVLGVIGGAGALGTNASTYRVTAVPSATTLTLQTLDGANFVLTTGSAQPYRIHPGPAADSFGSGATSVMSNQGSFTVPVRPLTNGAGTGASNVDGTWTVSTAITPLVAPPSGSATTWDVLSGLAGKVGPTTAIPYTAALQAPNAAQSAALDAAYSAALDALLFDNVPASEVAHVWCARKSATIRSLIRSHVLKASANGVGRTCSISPSLNLNIVTALTTVTGDADPGVGANRDERVFDHWPPVKTFVPEAVGQFVKRGDGTTGTDGIIDTTGDGWMSAIMGNLAPERNPGEFSETTKKVLAPVLGYATNVPNLDINAFKLLRLRGISGIRMDKTVGPIFQSGVTTSSISGQKNINRRKMADFIEDSMASAFKPFSKLPLSDQLKDAVMGQADDFLGDLLSPDNKARQRINGYLLDDKSGNTPSSEAKGIFVLIVKVRTTPTADFIVLQFSVGEGVVVSSSST
jgi:hypothetical protein